MHPGPFLFPAQQGSLPHGGPGILTTLEKGNLTNYWTSKKWANVTVFLVLILKYVWVFPRLAEEGSGGQDEVISFPLTSREFKRGLKAGM